ncbi:cytochrome c biogenesis protein [Desulfovibrio litoralis]|uniref:Heme exporter protein C n=1 Tax=Desulfovibrio litoralis DSM 11393 TaxID=1121455 RepID=A0A1M7RSK5_9BACT|nr:cytochrome c biogenesis protein CcsA [Desulfovibrio litoralis]SHN49204.1 heme exporter protein C [Desulfovibrio litoralis DSM 11393]
MHTIQTPINSKIDKFIPLLAVLGGLGFSLCQWLIFIYAPVETQMGITQKIFYFHLPFAWWSFISFFVAFVSGILYLYSKNFFWDNLGVAAVEVGVVFCSLALITGSIWARHSWNTWWTWDPRLTTSLVLWFIYVGYLIIRGLEMSKARLATISAVLSIIAFLDVPLVFFSARLWRTVHPAVFGNQNGGLEPEMKLTVFICLFAFMFFWLALVLIRQRQKTLETYLNDKAVQINLDNI